MRLKNTLDQQLQDLGLQPGDQVMVHTAYRALQVDHPETIIQALLGVIGETGTLLMPALSYLQQPPNVHDSRFTPSCVGYLSEYFRTRPGTQRSLHPTHSVCAVGAAVEDLLGEHILDNTPCGPFSPFHKLLKGNGLILMVGCGLEPNTSMHAIEEIINPPYLLGNSIPYTITDGEGRTFQKTYLPHAFDNTRQRYDRVAEVLDPPAIRSGAVGAADCYLIEAGALLQAGLAVLQEDPYYFVDPTG